MTSLLSMEDLFYGPREPTWIMPTPGEPRRMYKPQPPPPERYEQRVFEEPRPRPAQHQPRVQVVTDRPLTEENIHRHVAPKDVPTQVIVPPKKDVPTQVIIEKKDVPVQVIVPPKVVPTQVVPAVKDVPTQVVVPAQPKEVPTQVVVEKKLPPPMIPRLYPIELRVPMCCEKCVKKVKERLYHIEGVDNVVCDQYNKRVVVTGRADPVRVLEAVRSVKRKSAFWNMNCDFTNDYLRLEAKRADQARAEAARAEAARNEAAAKVKVVENVHTPAPAEVVLQLPKEHKNEPNVQVILPAAQQQQRHEPNVSVVLPAQKEHRNEPNVTVILPAEKENRLPMPEAERYHNSQLHRERYTSPPRGYRREEYYEGPNERRPLLNNRNYYDIPHGPHGELRRSDYYNDWQRSEYYRPNPVY